MSTKLEGSCLCGEVHYSGETTILKMVICHCTYCQKQTSSAFSTNFSIAKNSIQFQGKLSCYSTEGGSGKTISSYFCPHCSTVIYNELEVAPDFQFMKVGTLDDHTWFQPNFAVHCNSAQSWVNLNGDIEQSP